MKGETMKAQVLPHDLKAGLKWIKPAMAKKTYLSVLENVLVEASNQGIRLTATDLDVAASAFIGGKTDKPGRTTVPFKAFETLAKTLPDERLECYAKRNGHIALTQGSRTISVKTIDAEEFPITPTAKGKTYKALDDLLDGCKFVQHALATDDSRPALSHAEVKKGKLWAADGYRLAIAPGFNGEGSLHRSLVNFLARAKEEPSKLTLDDNLVTVWFGDNWVCGKQYEGRFPLWEEVMPKPEWSVTVDFQEFLAKVSLVASLKPAANLVTFQPKKGRLYIQAHAADDNLSFKDWIRATCTGKREAFGLIIRYLLDALRARKPFLKDGWLKLKIQTVSRSIMVVDQHTQLVEVVMPMHISR